jgi:hypothetical protein
VSKWTKFCACVVGLALVVGCGDDSTGPEGDDLTQQEKTALATALTQSGALAEVPYAGFAGVAVQLVGSIGSLEAGSAASLAVAAAVEKGLRLGLAHAAVESYEGAIGFIFDIDYATSELTEQAHMVAVVGWNGVNVNTNSVDNLVVGLVYGEGPASNSFTGDIGSFGATSFAIGAYWDGSEAFTGTAGTFSGTVGSFGSDTDCSGSSSGFTYECSYATGAMNGDLDFEAISESETTYTQTPLAVNSLPVLKLSISVSE